MGAANSGAATADSTADAGFAGSAFAAVFLAVRLVAFFTGTEATSGTSTASGLAAAFLTVFFAAFLAGFSADCVTTGSGVTPSTGGPAGRLAARRRVRLTVAALSSVFSTMWSYSSMAAHAQLPHVGI